MAKPFIRIVENATPDTSKKEAEPVPTQETVTKDHDIHISANMKKVIGDESDGLSITAPSYTTVQRGPLRIGYAAIDDDYYYQIELLKPAKYDDRSQIGLMITAFSSVIPDHIHVYFQPPPQELDWTLWTAVVRKAASLPGASHFMERTLMDRLMALDFWS